MDYSIKTYVGFYKSPANGGFGEFGSNAEFHA